VCPFREVLTDMPHESADIRSMQQVSLADSQMPVLIGSAGSEDEQAGRRTDDRGFRRQTVDHKITPPQPLPEAERG